MNTKKNKKLALKTWLYTYQILTNDDKMPIWCLSYSTTAGLYSDLNTTKKDRMLPELLTSSFPNFLTIRIVFKKKMANVFVSLNKAENTSVLLIIYFHRFGIDGKACVLRLICELAESKGLPYNGLMGRAIETLFL